MEARNAPSVHPTSPLLICRCSEPEAAKPQRLRDVLGAVRRAIRDNRDYAGACGGLARLTRSRAARALPTPRLISPPVTGHLRVSLQPHDFCEQDNES